MMRIFAFAIAPVAFCFTGCTQFSRVPQGPPTITQPLCTFGSAVNVSAQISQLHQTFALGQDSQTGHQILQGIRARLSCRNTAHARVMYSYRIDDSASAHPQVSPGCISITLLAQSSSYPYFEEWVACDPTREVSYLVDFNNILTRNKPIDPRLRLRSSQKASPILERIFGGFLPIRNGIPDVDEFLFESVAFNFSGSGAIIEDFYTIEVK